MKKEFEIFTGNFANVKKYRNAGLFPISIAISARYFNGAVYRPLNPERHYMMYDEKSYTPLYNEKLKKMSAKAVVEDIKKISNFANVVLLCHEGEDDFCHRHLVADWLEAELGIKVKELGKMKKDEQLTLLL